MSHVGSTSVNSNCGADVIRRTELNQCHSASVMSWYNDHCVIATRFFEVERSIQHEHQKREEEKKKEEFF
jgi:hypothetical protein